MRDTGKVLNEAEAPAYVSGFDLISSTMMDVKVHNIHQSGGAWQLTRTGA
jgi:hypothetical protein